MRQPRSGGNAQSAEVYAMVDSLGDVGSALKDAKLESLGRLYENLSIDLKYQPHRGS